MTDNVVKIPLSKTGKYAGKYEAMISDEDDILLGTNWNVQLTARENVFYAVRQIRKDGKKHTQYLHRLIMERMLGHELQKNQDVDHRDGDGLNNTRENLRLATRSQNLANMKKRPNKWGYKGVSFHKLSGLFSATIRVDGKRHPLGYYKTAELAHDAYKKAALEFFGEFANFGSNGGISNGI